MWDNPHSYLIEILMFKLIIILSLFQDSCFQVINEYQEQISFVTVKKKNKLEGLYTDEKGYFCYENLKKGDTLQFSAIGYFLVEKSFEELQVNKKIAMNQDVHKLPDLIVNTKKVKLKRVGLFNNAKFSSFKYGPNSINAIAEFIENDKFISDGIIKSLKVAIDCRGSSFKLRFRFFRNSSENRPLVQDLISENITIDTNLENKFLELNLEKYAIPFEEKGIWISIESLGKYDANNVFVPNKAGHFGKVKYSNNKPSKIKSIDYLAPSFLYKKSKSDFLPYSNFGGNKWLPIWNGLKLEMLLGLEVIY